MIRRITIFSYGLICYLAFFATFLYAVGFIGNFGVPRTIDSAPLVPLAQGLLVNLGLLSLFALQHSGMARPAFKRWLTRFVPEATERSTYVLLSSIALVLLFWYWQPLGGTVWQVHSVLGQGLLYGGYAFGWALVLVVTFLINHFDLFGLRQVWLRFKNRPYKPLKFVTPGPYRLVRHPLYVGWLCVFWFTPTMTVAHLLFAVVTTLYILVGIQLEERDLARVHPEYAAYRRRVPMLIPAFRRTRRNGSLAPATADES